MQHLPARVQKDPFSEVILTILLDCGHKWVGGRDYHLTCSNGNRKVSILVEFYSHLKKKRLNGCLKVKSKA